MKILSALFLVLSFNASAGATEELTEVYGVNSNNAMPLLDIERSNSSPTLKAGILKDLGEAIFKELGIPFKVLLLPKQRVAPSLLSGRISLICHSNEAWQPTIRSQVFWSHDLYYSKDLVTFLISKPLPSRKDLYGERVGTVLNFIYTGMDKDFKKGLILREDGPNISSNIQKLIKGRVNYVLMSNLEYSYFKKSLTSLSFVDLGHESVHTKCALSKKSSITLTQLNRAIDALKKNGTLDKILKSY